jgi:hypothetical protein
MDNNPNYQDPVGASQSEERLQNLGEDITTTPTEFEQSREQVMFEKYVQDGGVEIPSNFKSAGDWFNSLKEAQANYTKGQQELAALKQQYNEGGTANPNYVPEQTETPQEMPTSNEPNVTGDEELRLNIPEEVPEYQEASPRLTNEMWNQWSGELASTGEMSEQTMEQIQQITNFPKEVIEDYISAHKAKMRESFSTASEVVGSKERLKNIFEWAENTLSADDQLEINRGLASPSYEVTLRGLASMYDQRSVEAEKGREPAMTPDLQNVSASEEGFVGYKTQREFKADRNNPRFKLEPQFRQAVEQRMMLTDFNTLPQ